jgi:uncharacterized glyoxalase superfamily protein PhnB
MNVVGITPILNVSNVVESVAWFARLGFAPSFTHNAGGLIENAATHDAHGPATFAGVCSGHGTIFLCQDAQGVRGGKPPTFDGNDDVGATWMSIWLGGPAEVDEAHERAQAAGATILWPPTDEPWGARECRVMHPDGHVFRFSASLTPDAD